MTKYKLLKQIKGVEWIVGDVRGTEQDHEGDTYIQANGHVEIYAVQLALLEHAGFIEDVDETPTRWRAEEYGKYFYLNLSFEVEKQEDSYYGFDNTRYEACNYFQTTEQAEEFRKGVKALLGIN